MEYGLIGEHLGHSFSKDIHNLIGNYEYEIKEIAPCDVDAFMKARDFCGINVTIPYKQTVIPYLDEIDEAAERIGAVNTVVNKNGKLYGYNTDFYGMKSLLQKLDVDVKGKNVLILGTGGTSKTAAALVESLGASSVVKVSRKPENTDNDSVKVITYEEALQRTQTQIIINTTPCGMFPKADACPIKLDGFSNLECVVDAIYNPNCTNLVLDAKSRGLKADGGLYMLVMQAVKAAEFFFGKAVDVQKADRIFKTILARKQNIVLVGMPASGKSTVGKQLARYLNREFIDCDAEIVKKEGREITEIFAKDGEPYFRNVESQVIKELSSKTGCIIATGGGAILKPENVRNLRMNGRIYFIDTPLEQLIPTGDRPTADNIEKIKALYEFRYPLYKAAADVTVKGKEELSLMARNIILDFSGDDDVAIIKPGKACGKISAPPSKSMAHRMLICAALAEGESEVSNVDFSQDILATLDCLKAMGIDSQIDGNKVRISGKHLSRFEDAVHFDCRESGSTLRFFIPFGLAFCRQAFYSGSQVLMSRPLTIYEEICRERGITLKTENNICVETTEQNALNAGEFHLKGNISSQFITGLLFVLPLMAKDSLIVLEPPVESRPYINLTLQALSIYGVKAEWKDSETLYIPGGQKYKPCKVSVEGDYSNAAFLDVFNYIGGNVQVEGLSENSLQGDKVYKEMFPRLCDGCSELDISDCPDLGPVLFALAAVHNGAVFTGTKRLAIKESDRGKIMCAELEKFGIQTEWSENKIVIKKGELHAPAQTVKGYNDHRIVMALATLLTVTGGSVDDAHAVSKSFPGYYASLSELGIELENKNSLYFTK